jgi:hypothetical protein
MITVLRLSSGERLASINLFPGVVLAAIMPMLGIEVCVGWNMLIHVNIHVSYIQCFVAVRLVDMIGSSR